MCQSTNLICPVSNMQTIWNLPYTNILYITQQSTDRIWSSPILPLSSISTRRPGVATSRLQFLAMSRICDPMSAPPYTTQQRTTERYENWNVQTRTSLLWTIVKAIEMSIPCSLTFKLIKFHTYSRPIFRPENFYEIASCFHMGFQNSSKNEVGDHMSDPRMRMEKEKICYFGLFEFK